MTKLGRKNLFNNEYPLVLKCSPALLPKWGQMRRTHASFVPTSKSQNLQRYLATTGRKIIELPVAVAGWMVIWIVAGAALAKPSSALKVKLSVPM